MAEIRQKGARENQSKLCSDELQKSHKMSSSTGVDSHQRKLTFLHRRFPTANSCIRAPYVGRTWLPYTRVLVEGHDYPAPEYCRRDMVILYLNAVGATWLSCARVLVEGHYYPAPEYRRKDMVYPVPEYWWRDMIIMYPSTVGRTWLSCTRVLLEGHSLSCTRELLEGHGYPVSEHCWRGMVILHPGTVGGTWLFCTRALWQRRDDQSPCTPVLWRIKT